MKVCCVILNYNDGETTKALVEQVRDYQALDWVVVVDNGSTDQSASLLKPLAGGKVHLVLGKENGGYGAGNNLGIRYAWKKLGATHVLVANPDVVVGEACIWAMRQVMEGVKDCAVVSARVKDREGREQYSSWKLLGFWGDLLDTGLVARRLLRPWLQDSHVKAKGEGRAWRPVGAVCGSLFLADCQVLAGCGMFDPGVFLYCEEKILGHKLKEMDKKTLLLLNQSYVHLHSVSIDKKVPSIWKKQVLLHESKMYYYRKYLKANRFQQLVAKVFLRLVLWEVWFLTEVAGMRW